MKKTSTLKHAGITNSMKGFSRKAVNPEPSEDNAAFEPDAQTICNILNYSKALSVQSSVFMEHIVTVNN
ncbi:MAG TPA: hypothetical protein VGO45_08765 [Bacteroidia bacterium]|nr:hypothetical protein [Bacteroidia bacterium]